MIIDRELLKSAEKGKKFKGRTLLIKYLKGERLTRGEAILAHCYDCCGMDSAKTCVCEGCPLFPYAMGRVRKR